MTHAVAYHPAVPVRPAPPVLPALDTDTEEEDDICAVPIPSPAPRSAPHALPILLHSARRRAPAMAPHQLRQSPPERSLLNVTSQPMRAAPDATHYVQKPAACSSAERPRNPAARPPLASFPAIAPPRAAPRDRVALLTRPASSASQHAPAAASVPVVSAVPLRIPALPASRRDAALPEPKKGVMRPRQSLQQRLPATTHALAAVHFSTSPSDAQKRLALTKPYLHHHNASALKSPTYAHANATLRCMGTVPPMNEASFPGTTVMPHAMPAALPHAMGASSPELVSRGIKKDILRKWSAGKTDYSARPSAHLHENVQPAQVRVLRYQTAAPVFQQKNSTAYPADTSRTQPGSDPNVLAKPYRTLHSPGFVAPPRTASQRPLSSPQSSSIFVPSAAPRHPLPQRPQKIGTHTNVQTQQNAASAPSGSSLPYGRPAHGASAGAAEEACNSGQIESQPARAASHPLGLMTMATRHLAESAQCEQKIPLAVRRGVRKPRRYPKLLTFDANGVPVAVRKVAEQRHAWLLSTMPERKRQLAGKKDGRVQQKPVESRAAKPLGAHMSAENTAAISATGRVNCSARRERPVPRMEAGCDLRGDDDSAASHAPGLLCAELERVQRAASARYHIKMNLRGRTKLATWLQGRDPGARSAVALAVSHLTLDPALLSQDLAMVRAALSAMRNSPLRVLEALSARLSAKDGVANWAFIVKHAPASAIESKDINTLHRQSSAAVPTRNPAERSAHPGGLTSARTSSFPADYVSGEIKVPSRN